jgi:hypothetical protein
MNHDIILTEETYELLLDIVGDTGENEGADDVIKRLAKFYLKEKLGLYWETVKEK